MIKNYFLILKKIILFLLFFLIFSNKLYAANITADTTYSSDSSGTQYVYTTDDKSVVITNDSTFTRSRKLFIIDENLINDTNLSLLANSHDIELIKIISSFPRIIEQSAIYREPHRVAFYLRDLASSFHSYWNLGNEDNNLKVLNINNLDETKARLALIMSVKITISEGLRLLGINALDELR